MRRVRTTPELLRRPLRPGQRWLHFKGAQCEIVLLLHDAEADEPAVVYAKEDAFYCRTITNFLQEVEVSENWVPRFQLQFDPTAQLCEQRAEQ